MAAVQNLYNPHGLFLPKFLNTLIITETKHHFVLKLFLAWWAWSPGGSGNFLEMVPLKCDFATGSGDFFRQCFSLVHHMANLHENEKTIWRLFVSINLKRA